MSKHPAMRLSIVSVPVKDQQKAKAFYRDVLGFKVVAENPMGDDQIWIQMKPPKGRAGITLVTWFDKMPAGHQQGLVLETADITATHAELKSRGLKIKPVTDASWGRFTTFNDPDGNGWVLTEPAKAAPKKAKKHKEASK